MLHLIPLRNRLYDLVIPFQVISMRPAFLFVPFICSCVDVYVTPIKDDTGDTHTTDTSTVVTEIPSITSLSVSPNPAFTNDVLVATAESDDGYGSPAELAWSWSVNGSEVATDTSELDGASFFGKGDTVNVSVIPFSEDVTGEAYDVEIVISNTRPEAPSIQLDPNEVHEGGDDLICDVTAPSIDSDGDVVSYSIEWDLNGSTFSDTITTYWNGDTISNSHLLEGDVWTCTVTSHDDEEAGDSVSVSTTVLGPAITAAECTNKISSLDLPIEQATASGGGTYGIGAFMADSGLKGDSRLWVMMGYSDDTISEYPSLTSLQTSTGSSSIILDDDWNGTGHIVMNGVLYTNMNNSSEVIATDLSTGATIATTSIADIPNDASGTNSYGAKTYMDFNVDGEALYVIHTTNAARGHFVVDELDPVSLAILNSWTSPSSIRSDYAGAFISCGVLYAIDNAFDDDGPCFWCSETSVDLSWNLATNIESEISMTFTNPGTSGYIGGVSYNPVDGLIYVTRGGVLGTIKPTFQ